MTGKVLVTGGAGFIGSHIVERLLELGYSVAVVDNLSTGRIENLSSIRADVEFHETDVRNLAEILRLCSGVDYVIHEAAMNRVQRSVDDPIQANQINVDGTLNVLLAARNNNAEKLVYASSSSVYGGGGSDPGSRRAETQPTAPESPYAVSKLAAENYCLSFARVYGLNVSCLRYFSVYGPRQRADIQYAAVVPKVIAAVRTGTPLTIYGDGNQTRDFTYVKDTVEATVMCLRSDIAGVYNIARGERSSVNDLVEQVEEIVGKSVDRVFLPTPKGDWRDSAADITKITAAGFTPKFSLKTGLEDMLLAREEGDWYRERLRFLGNTRLMQETLGDLGKSDLGESGQRPQCPSDAL